MREANERRGDDHGDADGQLDRLSMLASELVRLQVTVLVANTTPPAFAAKAATATIPVVFVTGVDPVEVGLVQSFNRPGANVTGVTFLSNKLVAKRLELLASLVSGSAPIGMLAHARNPNTVTDVRDALATAAALGRTLHVQRVASVSELHSAVNALVQQGVATLFIAPQADFRLWREPILALASAIGCLPVSQIATLLSPEGDEAMAPSKPNRIPATPAFTLPASVGVRNRRSCLCSYRPVSILRSISRRRRLSA